MKMLLVHINPCHPQQSDPDDSHSAWTLAHAIEPQMWGQKGVEQSGDGGPDIRAELTPTGVVPGMSERPPAVEKLHFLPSTKLV